MKKRFYKVLALLVCSALLLSIPSTAARAEAVDRPEGVREFPSSYQGALNKLKSKHPNWKFIAVDTGLDWGTVIAKESVFRTNTLSSDLPNGGMVSPWSAPFSYLSTNSDCYDWKTDTYQIVDGSNRYTPASKVVAYYMDPRNFLTESKIFQFESLSYYESQSIDVVKSILDDTFMNGSYTYKVKKANGKKKKVTRSYAETFLAAAQKSGVSPYFLATRVRQEVGVNGSDSVSGKVPGYKGYYNFYNIGATDGAGAVGRGLDFAKNGTTYNRPWDNPYKAIVGGAKWIAEGYINVGQNTPYFQKFSVVRDSKLYWHQYMSNIQAPESEASQSYDSYQSCHALNGTIVFRIPVYRNMPASACALPKAAGNPNNYIRTVTLKNQKGKNVTSKVNLHFDYTTKTYQVDVPKSVSAITVSAAASSRFASLSGNNQTVSLDFGQTKTVKIKCTSQSGKLKTYSFTFTRVKAPTSEVITGKADRSAGQTVPG